MTVLLAVFAGGAGALARAVASAAVQQGTGRHGPWGTGVVNVVGAVALGALIGLGDRGVVDGDVLLIAGGGFLGAFTTFSTWMVETIEHGRVHDWTAAATGALLMLIAGVAGAALAMTLV